MEEETKAIAWKAQWRLCTRSKKLAARDKNKPQIVTAIGRELLGFISAIAVRTEAEFQTAPPGHLAKPMPEDTLNGLDRLAQTTRQKSIIVWLNEFFGEVREGSPSSNSNWRRIWRLSCSVRCSFGKLNPDTFEDDVQQMLRNRLTFEEAIISEDFSLVSKQRLQIVRRELFEQMDELEL
jgi:hypothetical protein